MGIQDEIKNWIEESKKREANTEEPSNLAEPSEFVDAELAEPFESIEESAEESGIETLEEFAVEEPGLLEVTTEVKPKIKKPKAVVADTDSMPDNGHEPSEDLIVTEPISPIKSGNVDLEAFKSELVKQGFDIPPERILSRSRLPRRAIVPLAVCATVDEIGDPLRTKSLMMRYMENYGYINLSEGGKIRMEILTGLATKDDSFDAPERLDR